MLNREKHRFYATMSACLFATKGAIFASGTNSIAIKLLGSWGGGIMSMALAYMQWCNEKPNTRSLKSFNTFTQFLNQHAVDAVMLTAAIPYVIDICAKFLELSPYTQQAVLAGYGLSSFLNKVGEYYAPEELVAYDSEDEEEIEHNHAHTR